LRRSLRRSTITSESSDMEISRKYERVLHLQRE
jgi:hypothetical protein